MKYTKSCLSDSCTEKKKKYKKDNELYCISCGTRLTPVCKQSKCYEQLSPDSEEAYCPVHLEQRREKAKKNFALAKKAATVAALAVFSAKVIYDGLNIKK